MGARGGTTHTAIDTQSTSGSLLPMYRAASCGWHLWLALPHHGQLTASLILESDDELEHGVKVQVRVVADGEERVVLQTNVEMMRCSSVPS